MAGNVDIFELSLDKGQQSSVLTSKRTNVKEISLVECEVSLKLRTAGQVVLSALGMPCAGPPGQAETQVGFPSKDLILQDEIVFAGTSICLEGHLQRVLPVTTGSSATAYAVAVMLPRAGYE